MPVADTCEWGGQQIMGARSEHMALCGKSWTKATRVRGFCVEAAFLHGAYLRRSW